MFLCVCMFSCIAVVYPCGWAPGSSDLSLCGHTGRNHRQIKHGGEGHWGTWRHGQSPLWTPVQLDRQPHQLSPETRQRQPVRVREESSQSVLRFATEDFNRCNQIPPSRRNTTLEYLLIEQRLERYTSILCIDVWIMTNIFKFHIWISLQGGRQRSKHRYSGHLWLWKL